MSAWGKANGVKDDFVVWIRHSRSPPADSNRRGGFSLLTDSLSQIFASDDGIAFSKSIGWDMGERTARYVIVVDHGKVVHAAKETKPGSIEVSGGDAVLPKL